MLVIDWNNGISYDFQPEIITRKEWNEYYSMQYEEYRAGGYDDDPIIRVAEYVILYEGTREECENFIEGWAK